MVRCWLVGVNVVPRSSQEPHPVFPLGAAGQDLWIQCSQPLYRASLPRVRGIVCTWLPFTPAVNKLDLLLFSQSFPSSTYYKSIDLHFATHICNFISGLNFFCCIFSWDTSTSCDSSSCLLLIHGGAWWSMMFLSHQFIHWIISIENVASAWNYLFYFWV